MATAKINETTTKVPVTTYREETKRTVTLELTLAEARAVKRILGNIGIEETVSRQDTILNLADPVFWALSRAGVETVDGANSPYGQGKYGNAGRIDIKKYEV